jgi:type I restriction enzyme, S subunit
MNGWITTTLGGLSRIRRGASPRPIDDPRWFAASGPGWVRIADVTRANGRLRQTEQYLSREGSARSVRVVPGDVLMSICATIGEPIIVDMDACIHDGFVVFDRFDGRLDRSFLLHLLRAMSPALKAQGQTGTQANLNTGIVNGYRVTIPESTGEQCRIAAVLDAIDAAIDKTAVMIAKLKQLRAGLLHDLLTRGLDDNGELRDPIKHPGQFKELPVGIIPKEWRTSRFDTVLSAIEAGKSPDYPDEPAPSGEWAVLKVSAIRPEAFRPEENKCVSTRIHQVPAFEVRDGDLLISRSNTYQLVGLVCIVRNAPRRLMLCDKTLRLVLRPHKGLNPFFCFLLQAHEARTQIEINATGTSGSMKNISQEVIRAITLAYPCTEEQQRIVDTIQPFEHEISTIEREIEKLSALKSGLMTDLLTGRVRVPESVEAGPLQ